jgi:hypothetical protein
MTFGRRGAPYLGHGRDNGRADRSRSRDPRFPRQRGRTTQPQLRSIADESSPLPEPSSYASAVELSCLLEPGSRIVDVGVSDPSVAVRLAEQGHERYLGLVAPELLSDVRRRAGGLQNRFHPVTSPTEAYLNNADLLILREPFVHRLWTVRNVSHVRYVAVDVRSGPASAEAAAALTVARLARRLEPLGRFSCGSERFVVVRAPGRRPPRPRQYLSPILGVEGFIRRVEDAGLDYAALRWFEGLPRLEPGEDLDLLVADQHLDKMQALLAEEPGTIPVDLYSETGLTGADYQGVAYYPPPLARSLLERTVRHDSGCRVPSGEDHLRSLAYHAVYHKGIRSGLPSSLTGERVEDPEHDYDAALQALSRAVNVELGSTLEAVDDYLEREGWRPPLDTLRRLAVSNPWIERRFQLGEEAAPDGPQVAAFFLREQAAAVVTTQEVLGVLDHLGFDVLVVRDLDEASKQRCAAHARGGNWGRGPFARSGGDPATVIVALHHGPRPPGPALRAAYPRLSNLDVLLAKRRVRDLVAARLEPSQQFNAMHSADTDSEAWEYIDLALPGEAAALRAEVERRRACYQTGAPVLSGLSRGRRAKVEIVRGAAGNVVRKTFAEGYLRHMERELDGIRFLGPSVAAVPELVGTGPNWFETPLYRNTLADYGSGGRLVPLRAVRQMVAVLREIHDQGFDLIDAKPQNFLLDPDHGLKIVDLEFLYRYPGRAPEFADSYSFVGVPEGFRGDVPFSWSYDWNWHRSTGLSRRALVEGAPLRQHAERTLYRLRWAATGPTAPSRRAARLVRGQLFSLRRRAGRRYSQWTARRAQSGFAGR